METEKGVAEAFSIKMLRVISKYLVKHLYFLGFLFYSVFICYFRFIHHLSRIPTFAIKRKMGK